MLLAKSTPLPALCKVVDSALIPYWTVFLCWTQRAELGMGAYGVVVLGRNLANEDWISILPDNPVQISLLFESIL